MTTFDAAGRTPSSSPGVHAHDGAEHPHHVENEPGRDRHDLVPVLAFLRHEINQSALVLGDLADRLSQALCALATADDQASHQTNLADAAIALQSEDRIQQRLCDLAAALAVLERTMAEGPPHPGADLDQAIIDSLRLEETRQAFAAAAGMADIFHQSSNMAGAPSIGDIDLF